jgi:hypothetical protein
MIDRCKRKLDAWCGEHQRRAMGRATCMQDGWRRHIDAAASPCSQPELQWQEEAEQCDSSDSCNPNDAPEDPKHSHAHRREHPDTVHVLRRQVQLLRVDRHEVRARAERHVGGFCSAHAHALVEHSVHHYRARLHPGLCHVHVPAQRMGYAASVHA